MNAPVDFNVIEGMFRRQYKQIEVRFDPEHATAWTYMKPSGAPCFNLGMLEELRAHDSAIESCGDRKSTRLNSSHTVISYAVFCLKKKRSRQKKKPSVTPPNSVPSAR